MCILIKLNILLYHEHWIHIRLTRATPQELIKKHRIFKYYCTTVHCHPPQRVWAKFELHSLLRNKVLNILAIAVRIYKNFIIVFHTIAPNCIFTKWSVCAKSESDIGQSKPTCRILPHTRHMKLNKTLKYKISGAYIVIRSSHCCPNFMYTFFYNSTSFGTFQILTCKCRINTLRRDILLWCGEGTDA